eukprot:scaffold145451_cov28-Attheya_sp.AAC.1
MVKFHEVLAEPGEIYLDREATVSMSANATAGVHSSVESNVGCTVVIPAVTVVGRATPKEYCLGCIWAAVRSSTRPSYPMSGEILKVNVRNLAAA